MITVIRVYRYYRETLRGDSFFSPLRLSFQLAFSQKERCEVSPDACSSGLVCIGSNIHHSRVIEIVLGPVFSRCLESWILS